MKESIEPDVHQLIRTIRGHRIILDTDLARIYGVPTFRLNEQIKEISKGFLQISCSEYPWSSGKF